jgi:hypothetical protein
MKFIEYDGIMRHPERIALGWTIYLAVLQYVYIEQRSTNKRDRRQATIKVRCLIKLLILIVVS